MKNTSLIINIVLAVAVVGLYVLHFTGNCGKKTADSTTGTAVDLPSGSIVYIQIDSLMSQFDFFHSLKSDLEAKATTIEADLNKKKAAFERDVKDYGEKVQKGLITRAQAEVQEQQLGARQQELQQFVQQKQAEMAEEEQVMLNNVLNELKTFLTTYNQEHNYSLILTTSAATNSVINGNATLDITKDVAAGLNQQYAQRKK